MSYLIPKDYNKTIQADNLMQVIGSDLSVLSDAEQTAMEEATSHLVQKYDVSQEFQDTPEWDDTVIYQAGNRVYLNPPVYVAAQNYAIGDYAVYSGNVYLCTVSTTGVFAPGSWLVVTGQYQIYFAKYPAPIFQLQQPYPTGTTVYWKGSLYTSLKASVVHGGDSRIQYDTYANIPPVNYFPDQNASFWGTPSPYTVPANTDIRDTAFWTRGDNRSQQLKTYLVRMALYYVHDRISPKNIPELRVKGYDDAVKWFIKAAEGKVTANLPVLQPKQGARVRSGGNVKQTNRY